MPHTRRCSILPALGLAALMAGMPSQSPALAQGADPTRIKLLGVGATTTQDPKPAATNSNPLTDDSRALGEREMVEHLLLRMTFGARPGLADAVLAEGWENWARRQLRPDSIDDATVSSQVGERYPSLGMSMTEIWRVYRPPYENDPPTMEDQQKRNQLAAKIRKELRESVIHRAVHSEAQFREVIAEFWRNHLNIDQQKDDVGYLANHYEEHVIRAHAFGKFEDMLLASARHPAMLIYLDNIVSQKPLDKHEQRLIERFEGRARKPRSVRALERYSGLNENYSRELMELHTLGVDNGYTQQDVTELARVLTGWSARWNADGEYGFYFRKDVHDTDAKRVVNLSVRRGGGEEEGIEVIRALARDRKTAQFIAHKLCVYLVNDNPDPALVRSVANVFHRTRGDLPQVYEAIIFSPQFRSRENFRAKFKTPFEFAVSALRATDATVEGYDHTLRAIAQMGQPVYQMEDPTGYDDRAERWLDPGVLVYRWRFALELARGSVKGVSLPSDFMQRFANLPPAGLKDALIRELLPAGVDEQSDRILAEEIRRNTNFGFALGLVLGSPTFQQQ